MSDDYVARTMKMNEKLGDNLWYTLKDNEGVVRPLAGLWESNGYGKEAAEERAKKVKSTVIVVKIEEQD